MAEIEFRNVSKVFPDNGVALKDFSLKVADGEFLVILGPSGCGKSTALRLLAGLETPSEGEILIADEIVNELSPQQRNVAMVFQNYALYPHKTVRGNLEFPLRMMGIAAAERRQRIAETAAILGLEQYLDRKPKQLSGGQRQRAAMGRALVRDPQVSLMDEPLSNLDAQLRVEIRSEIARLQQKLKITTLYVTHDQVEAMTLGDRVAVLRQGRLQQVDAPQRIYDCPCNTFVATFIGSPQMNLLRTRLSKEGDHYRIQLAGRGVSIGVRRSARGGPALERHIGEEILAGVRPEAFSEAGEDPSQPRLTGRLVSCEALGHERILYLESSLELDLPGESKERDEVPERHLAARLPAGPTPEPGQEIELLLDPAQVYLFDATGQAINWTPGPGDPPTTGGKCSE